MDNQQRAPTLLASRDSWDRTAVRVWGPDQRLVTNNLKAGIPGALIGVLLLILLHGSSLAGAIVGTFLPVAGIGLFQRFWPCRIALDGHGIAATTWRGTKIAAWTEIRRVRRTHSGMWSRLVIDGPQRFSIPLCVFPLQQREEIERMIRSRVRRKNRALTSGVPHPPSLT